MLFRALDNFVHSTHLAAARTVRFPDKFFLRGKTYQEIYETLKSVMQIYEQSNPLLFRIAAKATRSSRGF